MTLWPTATAAGDSHGRHTATWSFGRSPTYMGPERLPSRAASYGARILTRAAATRRTWGDRVAPGHRPSAAAEACGGAAARRWRPPT